MSFVWACFSSLYLNSASISIKNYNKRSKWAINDCDRNSYQAYSGVRIDSDRQREREGERERERERERKRERERERERVTE